VCDCRPVWSSNFCLGVNFLKIMFWFYVWHIRCQVATSDLVGFWCVFLLDVFWETPAMTSMELISSFICWIYSLCVWQVSLWFYICIINHLLQNTNLLSAGYLTLLILCVCVCVCAHTCTLLWGHVSTTAEGAKVPD